MAENNVRSAPAGPVPDITVKDYHLGEILNELSCWCTKWKGNINAVYNNALSMADQIAQLFQVVYTTVEAQEDVTGAFKQLYDFVNDYFTNLDLQDEVNNKINGMVADGTFVNLLLPYIQNGGVPVFVTSTSQMTDSKRIYVLMPNGHIYYWNGTAFADSNIVYGNTQFPLNSISSQNLGNIPAFSYINFPMNTDGKYLETKGGIFDNTGYQISPYIPVNSGETYQTSGRGGGYMCYYTVDFVFISSTPMSQTASFTTPENCSYIRASLNKQNNTRVFGQNNDTWLSGKTLDAIIKELHESAIDTNTYLGDKISMINYDNPKCIKNSYLTDIGTVANDANNVYRVHPLIQVDPNTTYYYNTTGGGFVCLYDENFALITSISQNTPEPVHKITTPENCKYLWTTIYANGWLVKDTSYPNPLLEDIIAGPSSNTMKNMRQTYGYDGDLTVRYKTSDNTIDVTYSGYPTEHIVVTRTSIVSTLSVGGSKLNETFTALLSDRELIFIHQFDKVKNTETYIVTDGVKINKFTSSYSASGRITTTTPFVLASAEMAKPKVWVYGDSYISMGLNRVAGAIQNLGWKIENIFGWPGIDAATSLSNLTNMVIYAKPDIIIWTLGMNGSESNSETYLKQAVQICLDNNILLIPATIPNVPERMHNTFNAYVKNNFTTYLDWAKAVNTTETGAEWYEGMLGTDNIHPTELGAQRLALECLGIMPLSKIS